MDHSAHHSTLLQLPHHMRPHLPKRALILPFLIAYCENCDKLLENSATDPGNSPRCSWCHHFSDEEDRLHIGENDHHCICFYHLGKAENLWCTCPCECSMEDNGESDETYGLPDEMKPGEAHDSDMVYESEEDQPDLNISANHIRRYGLFTAATKADGRAVWYESGLHYHAATGHNIAQPEESSLVNVDNYISQREVIELHQELQPDEIECAIRAFGVPLEQIAELLPEARQYIPEPLPRVISESACDTCGLLSSDETRQGLRDGQLQMCPLCAQVIRPAYIGDDPDFSGSISFSVHGLSVCQCRCDCLENDPACFPQQTAQEQSEQMRSVEGREVGAASPSGNIINSPFNTFVQDIVSGTAITMDLRNIGNEVGDECSMIEDIDDAETDIIVDPDRAGDHHPNSPRESSPDSILELMLR